MANDLGGNPLVVDTASATAIWEANIPIERIRWESPTTAGHQVTVKDGANSRTVWTYTALAGGTGINYEVEISGWVHGLTVPTLGSGKLYIYIK